MLESEVEVIAQQDASTPVDAQEQPTDPSARAEALGRDDNQEADQVISKAALHCHHFMESGFYCQSPALRNRRFCYSHLRLRGQRIRMARAIARRIPYRFDLPALDDLYAVQVAVEHVARALAAGLMKREEATGLLWSLQQSAINHRNLAQLRMNENPAMGAGAPPLSPVLGDRVGEENQQKRRVEEYPEFEAEFGLAAGIDVSRPHMCFFLLPRINGTYQLLPVTLRPRSGAIASPASTGPGRRLSGRN
jgi:hypothetical protein